jgi:hypothetical protein
MKLLRPIAVTDAVLQSSTVVEADAAAYNPATTYAAGAVVMYGHRLYKSAADGNLGNTPGAPASADKWTDTAPTNRWAAFDNAVGTVTSTGQTLTMVFQPGYIDALAFLETQAANASISLVSGSTLVYSRHVTFEAGGKDITDWYMYFFAPVGRKKSAVVEDIPMYENGVLTVTLTHESNVQCGVLLMGTMYPLGETLARPSLSFQDFSRKATNDFGVTTLVERPFKKLASLQVKVPTSSVDELLDELAKVRARPVLYIGDGRLDWLRVYGLAKRAEVSVEYVDYSFLTLDLEGLI